MDIYLLRPENVTKLIVDILKYIGIVLNIPATLPQVMDEVVDVGQV